jgi:hypothetical protein
VQDSTTICSTKMYPFLSRVHYFMAMYPLHQLYSVMQDMVALFSRMRSDNFERKCSSAMAEHTPKMTEVNTNVAEPW